jgi:hypothetical protein
VCGGIDSHSTFSTEARIRVVEPEPNEGTEVIQLVAAKEDRDSAEVDVNVAYGRKATMILL